MTLDPHLAGWSLDDRLDYEQDVLRMLVAARIENLMADLGINQKELAGRIGATPAWVSKLLGGEHNPTLKTLAKIGVALGVRWNPHLTAARREDTPAAADRPLPNWVEGTIVEDHGEASLPISADLSRIVDEVRRLTGTTFFALPRALDLEINESPSAGRLHYRTPAGLASVKDRDWRFVVEEAEPA